MDNKPQKKTSNGYKLIIVILLIITTISTCLALYAWARYITQQGGSATAGVARWNFNVSLKAGEKTVTAGSETIDLATTEYNYVANDRIAPGTSGEFDIIIDTTGTEVSLVYDVDITLRDCPRNIVFSKKAPGAANATVISDGGASNALTRTISFSKYVAVKPTNNNGVFTETIYWDWPYQAAANATATEKTAYDVRDTEDQGKTVTMNITVTGTEVLDDPERVALIEREGGDPEAEDSVQTLAKAGTIKRWDKVNYNPGTLTTASIDLPEGASIQGSRLASIASELPAGATLAGTISASDATEWVVLDVNKTTGEVKIIPRTFSQTNLTLSGMDGYNNAIEALDKVASIYLNSTYAKSAKSITMEDFNKAEGQSATGSEASYSWNHRYGMDDNLNITDAGEGNTPSQTYTSTAETGYYSYPHKYFSGSFWLASRCVYLYSGSCGFYVRLLRGGLLNRDYLFYVNSSGSANTNSISLPVLPVVTLKSGIKVESDETFYTETATGTIAVENETQYEHHVWKLK